MSIATAIIGLAMLVFAGLLVTRPLWLVSHAARPMRTPSGSGRRYDETLLTLRDLEFDHELGVVNDDDYTQHRALLMSEAAEALKRRELARKQVEEAIETAVHARRKRKRDAAACPTCEDRLAMHDKFCPHCGTAVATNCPNCQHPAAAGDRFCSVCGTSLAGGDSGSAANRLRR